ncbi:MAG: hypothetical protein ACI8U3_000331 [Brevundimonas sp.]|jgi:hypothetical protein|uniref:hypothetical protein n=1 Tax=Brevundimonas sp. TaxID=1871086 RepID=UPI0039E26DD4
MSADTRFLAALAEELARGRVMAETLAPLLSTARSGDSGDSMIRAQGLDLLVQHLDALAAMTARVAQGDAPGDAVVAAPLGGLVERMCAALDGRIASATPHPPPSGDLMLFD